MLCRCGWACAAGPQELQVQQAGPVGGSLALVRIVQVLLLAVAAVLAARPDLARTAVAAVRAALT